MTWFQREKSLVINSDRQACRPPPWWFTYFSCEKVTGRKGWAKSFSGRRGALGSCMKLQPAMGLHNPWLLLCMQCPEIWTDASRRRDWEFWTRHSLEERKILTSFRTLCSFSVCFFTPVLLTCLVNSFPFFKTQLTQPLCEGPSHFLCEDVWLLAIMLLSYLPFSLLSHSLSH